jgi:hypothetical protein
MMLYSIRELHCIMVMNGELNASAQAALGRLRVRVLAGAGATLAVYWCVE